MTRPRRRWPIVLAVIGLLLVLLLVLIVDLSPAVAGRGAPSAAQVGAGRDTLRRVRDATRQPAPATRIAFSPADLDGLVALGGNTIHLRRTSTRVEGGGAEAAASLRLISTLWLNLRVAVAEPVGNGFPPLEVSIGDLDLPRWLTRLGLGGARQLALLRGARLPPLDQLVRSYRVTPRGLELLIATPLDGTGLVRELVGLGSTPVDSARVAALYCRLVAAERRAPAGTLEATVKRVFSGMPEGDVVAENRAALVALAMLTVGPRAGDLAGNATDLAAKCMIDPPGVLLGNRVDLAKHWTLSAALGATVGGDVTTQMGEWKELSDSLPGGSGFSFVDLSADRAGLRVGRALVRERSATMIRLLLARDPDLLPLDTALMTEGVTNAAFEARYGSIDGGDYRAAVRRIDQLLDASPLLAATL